MGKIITLLLLLVVQVGFPQATKTGFSIRQIDSIANLKGRSGIAEGQITTEKQIISGDKKQIVKGEGQSSVAIYTYVTDKFSRLIKGDYHRNIRYDDKSSQEVYAQFYYNEKQLVFIKLTEHLKDASGETTKDHTIYIPDLSLIQTKDFLFTDNVKKWISQVDEQIIKVSGHGAHKKIQSN